MHPELPATPATYGQATSADRKLRSLDLSAMRHLDIVVGGNANVDFLVPGLRSHLANEGIAAAVRSTAHGGWINESFADAPSDVWVIWISSMGATRGMTARTAIDISATVAATERLIARGTKVIVVLPEPLIVENDPFSPFASWRLAMLEELRRALPPAVVQLSIEHVVRNVGMSSFSATRYWTQAKAPCHPDAATLVGVEVASTIARMLSPRVRAVAVDLDDTLWGGLVGEVGPQGLELDPDGSGRPYLELQRFLLDASDRGIAVGVVSKNDEEQARRPFLDRPEMVLGLDAFVRFEASWEPKYLAIQRLADQLNIGIDSVCFLDDSQFERDEAARMLPGLITPDLSMPPDRRVDHLIETRLFMNPQVSDEDKLRVAFFKRTAEPAPSDLMSYLESLDMTLEVSRVSSENIDRVVSLLHKTNQFNVTMWRPSPSEVAELLSNEQNYAYAYRLVDRLGDAGVISVLLAETRDGVAQLRSWVMSCRVFSRGVEWAVAEHFATWLSKRSIDHVSASYVAGPRNGLVAELLANLGLSGGEGGADAESVPIDVIDVPKHCIRIVDQ